VFQYSDHRSCNDVTWWWNVRSSCRAVAGTDSIREVVHGNFSVLLRNKRKRERLLRHVPAPMRWYRSRLLRDDEERDISRTLIVAARLSRLTTAPILKRPSCPARIERLNDDAGQFACDFRRGTETRHVAHLGSSRSAELADYFPHSSPSLLGLFTLLLAIPRLHLNKG